jgi:SAM-dependent methyltransferase
VIVDINEYLKLPLNELKLYLARPEFYKLYFDVCEQNHGHLMDKLLGLDSLVNEKLLVKNSEHKKGPKRWIGLSPQTLQAPYHEMYDFFSLLKEEKIARVIDFGAGYGRLALLTHAFFPDAEFIGLEAIEARVQLGRKMLQQFELDDKASLVLQDLLQWNFKAKKYDLYFIYDFSDVVSIKNFLEIIKEKFVSEDCFIVARGKAVRSLIQNKYREFWALHGVYHSDNWSLYCSFKDI